MERVASPGLMHGTGCLGLVHWDDPGGTLVLKVFKWENDIASPIEAETDEISYSMSPRKLGAKMV